MTTAATIWLAAALGMGIAVGKVEDVLVATAVTLIVLLIFPRVVSWINKLRDAHSYKIIINSGKVDKMEKLQRAFKECRLLVSEDHMQITEEAIITSWRTIGTPKNQERFVRLMVKDKDITSLEY